ncbi:MAG: transposase [Opitutaceae bacterium]|nr:transposase [Opitutaceae bacterium]
MLIMARAVKRGLERRSTEAVTHIGLDEKSFGRGQDYVSLMTDLKNRRVLEVSPVAAPPTRSRCWKRCRRPTPGRRGRRDGHGRQLRRRHQEGLPQAAIVHDRFHVSMHLNEAVDKVRRQEHRRLLEEGDTSLTGTKFLWLQGAAPEGERALDLRDELCERNLKTARAWTHKETFIEFWSQESAERGQRFFTQWYKTQRPAASLEPLKKVARMLKAHLLGPTTTSPTRDQRDHRRLQFPHPSH